MAKETIDILVLEGDGIGPEITAATLAVLRAADAKFGLRLAFETAAVGWAAHRADGTTFPHACWTKAKAADGVLLGPVSHNEYPPVARRRPQSVRRIAQAARPLRQYPPGALARRVFRRAAASRSISSSCARTPKASTPTATCISGSGEFMPTPDLALAVRKITRARLDPHRGDRLQARDAAAQESHRRAQGQCAARLRRALSRMRARGGRALSAGRNTRSASSTPWRRFWCATPASSTSSSPPICTATFSPTRRARSPAASGWRLRSMPAPSTRVAQAQHGSAPDIAGKNIANPSSLIGSAAMLLAWLGERRGDEKLVRRGAGDRGRARPRHRQAEGRTPDLGGPLGTDAFGARVARRW